MTRMLAVQSHANTAFCTATFEGAGPIRATAPDASAARRNLSFQGAKDYCCALAPPPSEEVVRLPFLGRRPLHVLVAVSNDVLPVCVALPPTASTALACEAL